MSVVRNTLGKEPIPQDPGRPISDEALREYCDKNYHQILPIIAEKVHQEKAQQEKLKAVKARLNFEETSRHSELGTPIRRRDLKERLRPRFVRGRSGSPEPRRGRSESPKKKGSERKTVFKRLEKGVFHRIRDKGKSVSVYSDDSRCRSYHSSHRDTESCHQSSHSKATKPVAARRYNNRASSKKTEELLENEGSAGDPFTRIRYFDFPKTRMPSHIKTYDGSEDPKDHLKIFQSAAKTERWAMPTWCHMFNSILTGNARVWFDDLPKETIDSYDDLKKAFLENYLQQKKCIKDPVKIHNIRQRDGESTEEFVRRYKLECRDVKGAPECMKISGFMHGITNPELIKRLHDKIPKSVDEMMRVTTTFLRGEVAASNRERKKLFLSWKHQEANQKQNFKKGGFRNQQRTERKQDHFALLTKTPKEIFALDKGKFKAPSPMTTPVEKRNANKFCEFHGEIKQNNGKEQPKVTKKEETARKDKAMAILMVQPWERVARQRITQSFSPNSKIFFPPLGEDEGTKGPMIIEAEIGGHCVHRMHVDGGSASEILYEHCFSRLRPEIKKQLIPTTTPLIGFSGEIIWPIGQIQLLVTIGDEEHSASALINFIVVRSPFPYNGIIGRPEPADMTGVPRHIAEHRLNMQKGCSPIRQKKREQAADRNHAMQEEVGKLVEAGIMKEVHYHDWLSNPVMVKKHDNSWRMCVDFKDLNKACLKDSYPLSEIDSKVESLCGFPFKCFLDAYKGYHQIQMAKEDEEKTTFITNQGIFCYTKIPFGLQNTGATYQRLVDKAFHKQIDRNLEGAESVSGKSRCCSKPSIPKVLKGCAKVKWKARKSELVFSQISREIITILQNFKKIHEEKQFPLDYGSGRAFKQMKQLITELPIRALRGPEVNYTSMEKLVLALVHASKRLKRYFQAHPIIVITDQPIQQVLSRPKVAGRLRKWSIELGEYAIHYRPRVSVKGQILADFIVEPPEEEELPKP
ncbi:reverse transcriptase domain-containing protein [Tanacetum coccineum]